MLLSEQLKIKIVQLLAQRRKIEAIKLIREETGCGLKEAKDLADELEAGHASKPPGSFSDETLMRLILQGKKLEAIKMYKEATGAGLRESKDHIDALTGTASSNSSNSSRDTQITDILQAQGSNKKGCFIATACYGGYDTPEVLILRHFRDTTLQRSWAGRLFIRLYYRCSPAMARRIARSEGMKKLIRVHLLQPFIKAIKAAK